MGLRPFGGSSCSDDSHTRNSRVEVVLRDERRLMVGNPDPCRFRIIRHKQVGRFTIVVVEYPDCMNFEGKKIMVFENATIGMIRKLDSIDPHFCDSGSHLSPIARFIPTSKGWDFAVQFAKDT